MRLRLIPFCALVLLAAAAASRIDARGGPGPVDRIGALLRLPPPDLNWREASGRTETPPPGDDAPLDVLAGYWAERADSSRPERPTDDVRRRLLDACEERPARLPKLFPLLIDAAETHDRVWQLLSQQADPSALGPEWTAVRDWLRRRSTWLRDDLVRKATAATDDRGWVVGLEDLEALARLDWAKAEPILKDHAVGDAPRTAALALALAYAHAVVAGNTDEESLYRQRLQAIVSDRKVPGWARQRAFGAVMRSSWPGRDDWYLSLFADPTLSELNDGYKDPSPLVAPVKSEPERWIPIVTGLVGHPDRAVHDAAVGCLIQFHGTDFRADALRPLLPWLGDPAWSSAPDRLRLIQSLPKLSMPESVPSLIWVVANDPDATNRAYASEALADYPDSRALPALHSALARDGSEYHRPLILKGLLACGLSEDDQVAGVEAYAQQTASPEGQAEFERAHNDIEGEKPLSVEVSLGAFLSRRDRHPREVVVARLLERIREVERSSPEAARRLREIAFDWPGEVVDRAIVARLAGGRAEALTIAAALARRAAIRVSTAEGLTSLLGRGREERGIAAVLLGDPRIEEAVLRGSDRAAQRALLASARLAREPLPIPLVHGLFRAGDARLDEAAETYLKSEDSVEARQLVLARHPREALILGAPFGLDLGPDRVSLFQPWEDRLRQELLRGDGPNEILALLTTSWGNNGQIVIRIRGSQAHLTHYADEAHGRRRALSPHEIADLREFLSAGRVDDLPPLMTYQTEGVLYEYLRLSLAGGHRVSMYNPGLGGSGGSVYHRLRDRMKGLLETGNYTDATIPPVAEPR